MIWSTSCAQRARDPLVLCDTNVLVSADLYNDHMPRTVTATEAKAKILALLDEVAAGEEVQITRHGHVVARVVPAGGPQSIKGTLAGVAMSAVEDEGLFTTGVVWDLP